MKTFWDLIIKNLSNLFGLIGILLTLYFGIYYVPNWLRETQNEKILNANKNLEQSVKELIYSDSLCNYSEIEVLIKAKELFLKESYPFTMEDVLTQVQESFMQDRFLPLEKRKQLISELEVLKKNIPEKITEKTVTKETASSTLVFEWLSILISIFAVIAGTISFFLKFRTEKDKQEEIENQIIESDNFKPNIEYALKFEKSIVDVIKKYPGIDTIRMPGAKDFGFDLEFDFRGKTYFVEIKYLTRSKIGLNSFQRFLVHQKGLEGEFWFVYNTGLTEMVKRKVEEINKFASPRRNIQLIYAENLTMFKEQLKKLLPAK